MGTPICDVPQNLAKIDRNVKYFLRISSDFVTSLVSIKQRGVLTPTDSIASTVVHIVRDLLVRGSA
jgi:hypothetical protein